MSVKLPFQRACLAFLCAMLAMSCQHSAKPAAMPAEGPPPVAKPALVVLPGADCLPELTAAVPAEAAAAPMGKAVLEWACEAASVTDIPETTYTLYREFSRVGERDGYQRPYYTKRTLLTQEVLAAWLGEDDSRMDRISDLLWSVCEETTWVLPAHERGPEHIDLFAAETGTLLAHTLLLLGDRLPEEIRLRVQKEVKSRLLDPYLKNALQYGWNSGSNNWTGVCAGSVGECFLLMETDPERLNQGVALVCDQLGRFIQNAFAPDGGCLEGIGYWNYGLSHFVSFGEMLRSASAGAVDLLDQDKVRAIAHYPLSVSLGSGLFASFSDGHEHSSMHSYLCARLGERTGVPELRGLPGNSVGWGLGNVLRNVLWSPQPQEPGGAPTTVFMPESGVVRMVGATPEGLPLVIAAKAGSNAEPHNHNDVGSFIVCVDGAVYLCDPGGGLYNRDYFSSKRYDNVFANSYGHSVPRIGGKLQSPGKEFTGTMEMPDSQTARIAFHQAYNLPALKEAVRTIKMEAGSVTLSDTFGFEGAALGVEEALLTWLPVEVSGNAARIVGEKGVLEVRVDQGVFAAERLDKACRANRKSEALTRLTVTSPAAPSCTHRFTMTYHPVK
jgi:hypothetical protein